MVAKAEKWARLRHKENKDKKIVILFHNYPPKNSNIGSAVALDTMESVRRLLAAMRDRGYKVDFVPRDTKEFISLLTACATNDRSLLTDDQIARAPKVSAKEYGALYETLEPSVQVQMEKDWGPAPGTVMACDGGLLVPGIEDGNIFITVQPPRGFGEDPEKSTTILLWRRPITIWLFTGGCATAGRPMPLPISARTVPWNGCRAKTRAWDRRAILTLLWMIYPTSIPI